MIINCSALSNWHLPLFRHWIVCFISDSSCREWENRELPWPLSLLQVKSHTTLWGQLCCRGNCLLRTVCQINQTLISYQPSGRRVTELKTMNSSPWKMAWESLHVMSCCREKDNTSSLCYFMGWARWWEVRLGHWQQGKGGGGREEASMCNHGEVSTHCTTYGHMQQHMVRVGIQMGEGKGEAMWGSPPLHLLPHAVWPLLSIIILLSLCWPCEFSHGAQPWEFAFPAHLSFSVWAIWQVLMIIIVG